MRNITINTKKHKFRFNKNQIVEILQNKDDSLRTMIGRVVKESDEFNNVVFYGYEQGISDRVEYFYIPDFTVRNIRTSQLSSKKRKFLKKSLMTMRKETHFSRHNKITS